MKLLGSALPFVVAGLVGLLIVAGWGFRKLRAGRRGFASRHKGALLRPPGHSLSEKLSEHGEGMFLPLAALFLGSGISGAFVWAIGIATWSMMTSIDFRSEFAENGWSVITSARGFWSTMFILGLGILGGAGLILWGRCQFLDWLRSGYRLRMGLRGEQAVAEEMQVAVRAGYHLFHDIPTDAKCNIDHVVVGHGGVYALETKARSKAELDDPDKAKAVFNGTKIEFTGIGTDSRVARQAEANARWLEENLTRSTGRQVRVKPVIVLPGWYVPPNNFPTVIARNPEYFAKELRNSPEVLSPGEISAITFQLERLCRDVTI